MVPRSGRKPAGEKRTFIVGGNWKCATDSAKVDTIVAMMNSMSAIPDSVEVFCAPPNPHIATVINMLRTDVAVSSQDCGTNFHRTNERTERTDRDRSSPLFLPSLLRPLLTPRPLLSLLVEPTGAIAKYGAYTGDMFSGMLKDLGCEWAIVGHSERRQYQGESSDLVASKAKAALDGGLGAVVCIGESKEEREAGMETIKQVLLDDQMAALVKALGTKPEDWANVVIAYEPVWAIGTGLSATPEMAQETHLVIREWAEANISPEVAAALRIQYGGSVKGATALELAKQPDIDGFLVGSASLKDDFLVIIENAAKAS
jgi:triosephosphate isomerase